MNGVVSGIPTSIRDRPSILHVDPIHRLNGLENQGLLAAPDDIASLTAPIEIVRHATNALSVVERNVVIHGFRSLFTEDGKFFIDESVIDGFRYKGFFTKVLGSQPEDMQIVSTGETFECMPRGELIEIDRPVFCISSDEPSNYGSWIYRILPKLINFEEKDAPLFVYTGSPWMSRLLEFFLGRKVEVIVHNPVLSYRIREAVIPSIRNIDVYFDEESRLLYKHFAARTAGYSKHEKIYLSRRNQRVRPIRNEAEVEAAMKERGFEIIYLETLTPQEQVVTLRDARVIVCPGGSGLFNVVFANNAEFILDIEPSTEWLYAHHNLLRSTHRNHTILFGSQEISNGDVHSEWTIPLDAVLRTLIKYA